MSIINGVNYDELARVAENTGTPFEVLAERAEKGLPVISIIENNNPDWCDYTQASEILGVSYNSLASVFTDKAMTVDYWGVRWKSRSKIKKQGKRGCGVLFYRKDLERIRQIRRGARIMMKSAMRVFEAQKLGRI